ncbi:MAG: MarR family transcriptional regulator [Paracoccaceae bacterium]|nr:MarR family transcriptional regulator [Paracoccaceae bacterium]
MSREIDRAGLAVEQWRREIPGLELEGMEILGRISEIALRTARDYIEPLIAEHGLKRPELDALLTLRRAGPPYRMTPTQLFETMMMSSGGMTSLIDRLERAGWVERAPNPEDRRGTLVSLTGAGRALTEALVRPMTEGQTRMVAGLTVAERAALSGLLQKLLAGLSDGGGR